MFLSNVVVSLYFKCFIVLRNGFSEIRVPLASLLVRCFFVLVPLGKSSYFYGNIRGVRCFRGSTPGTIVDQHF